MKIRADAWHLRFVRYIHGLGRGKRYYSYVEKGWIEPYTPRDLCSYFWGGLLTSVVAVLIGLGAGLLFVGSLVYIIVFLFLLFIHYPLQAVVGTLIGGGLGGVIATASAYRRYRAALPPQPKRPKTPNIVVEGIKAIKHRYCPIIEVEE